MVAAVALLVKDAGKLTLGQELQITTPHAIEAILRQPPDRWISNARLTHYQGLLLNPTNIIFQPPTTLNLASLLPDPDLEAPLHDCADILAQVCGIRADLKDVNLPDAELTWYTDGSSFEQNGQRYADVAVTNSKEIQDHVRTAKIVVKDYRAKIEKIASDCKACLLKNPTKTLRATKGARERGTCPGAYWEVDFTEVKPGQYGYRYLLVFIDTFSGWAEAYPTKKETAQVVRKKLLEEILPQFGFPA